jgi:hypothetical protein
MRQAIDIEEALRDKNLLGASFLPLSSWLTWLVCLKAIFALPLTIEEREAFMGVAGGRAPPSERVRELWALCGRRSGKSRIAAALAVFYACLCDFKLAAGEVGTVLVLAGSKEQGGVVFAYIAGILKASPFLASMIESETADTVTLSNGAVIAVASGSYRTVRGRSLLACIMDEVSFWRSEDSALPDVETYRAVLPALATTNGLLIAISSAYRKRGLMFEKHRDYFGKNDEDVLVVQGATAVFNPTIDRRTVDRAIEDDPEAGRSEWLAEFRGDLSSLLEDELIDDAVDRGRPLELPPRSELRGKYVAFTDASAGRHDAFALCVGHVENDVFVADLVRGRRPPFDPQSVASEYGTLAREYWCGEITGDAFAGEWTAQAFEAAKIKYKRAEHVKSTLYLEGLPYFSRGQVAIPNHELLIRELRLLERRTTRSGKDVVDHPPAGSDDHANVLFGAIWLAKGHNRSMALLMTPERLAAAMRPSWRTPPPGQRLWDRYGGPFHVRGSAER